MFPVVVIQWLAPDVDVDEAGRIFEYFCFWARVENGAIQLDRPYDQEVDQ